jgi:hypothetical protein
MVGVGPDQLAALLYAPAAVALARLVLCIAIVPILAAHDYELELTWKSISLTPAKSSECGGDHSTAGL